MKTTLFTLFLLPYFTPAFAANALTLPPTASPILETTGSSWPMQAAGNTLATLRSVAIKDGRQSVQKKLENSDLKVSYACRAVYSVWGPTYILSNDGQVDVTVYCDPRSFPEKVAMSAQQACEQDPKPACMSPQYMNMFAKLKPTFYIDINQATK